MPKHLPATIYRVLAALCMPFLLLAAHAPAGRALQYVIAPAPVWAEVSTLPDPRTDRAEESSAAVRYVLLDRQIRVQETSLRYNHVAVQLLNPAGVERQSQIQIRFDPQNDRLRVHAVTIHRGTQIIDQLKTGRIEVLQRENGLEEGLLDGELTFHLVLSDVRVGDTLEYSYTIDHSDPEWGNRFYGRYTTRWDDPVEHSRLRVWTREHAPLYISNRDTVQPVRKISGGWQSLEWSWSDIPALVSVPDAPVGYEQHPSIELSQFASWQEVAEAAEQLYALPAKESLERAGLVARFRDGGYTDSERVLAVIHFVQEEVRYTGIELGQGAYRPRSPDQVLAQRYGDCKDKALLAVALLRSMGIEAAPVLVSTDWRAQLRSRLPSPGPTNHVIVQARVAGTVYWFDVTSTAQGGNLAHFTQSDLGAGLVIAAGVTELQTIPATAADEPLVTSTAIFNLRQGLDRAAGFVVSTLYRGSEADSVRRRLRTQTAEELGRQYLNYYKTRYPGIRALAPPLFKDDMTANEMTVNESYEVDRLFEADSRGRMVFDIDADAISVLLKAPETSVRAIPLALDFPTHVAQQIEIEMPEDWPVKESIEAIRGAAFRYDSRVSRNGNDIHLEYRYRTLTDQVSVDQLAGFLKDLERARLDVGFSVSYKPSITPDPGRGASNR